MFSRIASKVLEKEIGGDVQNIDELLKVVLAVKSPHLYYSYLKTSQNSAPISSKQINYGNCELTDDDIWIFGYGSLVWKADFPHIAKLPGFITGYERKFYQNSIDHRGIPTFPGRVVTLIPNKNEGSRVYGVAYRIAASKAAEVLKHLDYREKNGYDRCSLEFNIYDATPGTTVNVIMYVANSENESFAGHISNENEIAQQIYLAVGPSGFNRDYVYNLEEAMLSLFPGVEDQHLHSLVTILRNFEEKDKHALEECSSSIEKLVATATGSNTELVENEIACLLLDFIGRNK